MKFANVLFSMEEKKIELEKKANVFAKRIDFLKQVHDCYPKADYYELQYAEAGFVLKDLGVYKKFDELHVCDGSNDCNNNGHLFHELTSSHSFSIAVTPIQIINGLRIPYCTITILTLEQSNKKFHEQIYGLSKNYFDLTLDSRASHLLDKMDQEIIDMLKAMPGIRIQKEFLEECSVAMEEALLVMEQSRIFI